MRPNPVMFVSVLGYLVLCAFFFFGIDVAHKIALPVFWLACCSMVARRWLPALAFLLSSAGDLMGSFSLFLPQLGFFLLSHLAFIACFMKLIRKPVGGLLLTGVVLIGSAAFILAYIFILAHIPSGGVRAAACCYALVILTMCACAVLTHKGLLAIGAILFVISDSTLAWNKFVSPLPYAGVKIMVTYYAAEIFLFTGLLPAPRLRRPAIH